jgi:hypothetical protein
MNANIAHFFASNSTMASNPPIATDSISPIPDATTDEMWPRMFGNYSQLTGSGGDFGFVLAEERKAAERAGR